ncbi:hypothetical protein RirG_218500 [Rhizophagus irregularis DAOM 197198w]|nr:hypothetical protein RirG_218500 [Rhizophagus irregularis DAOM 197198w]
MVCAICTAIKLYVTGKNYLIAILAVAMAVGEFIILLSIIWISDFKHGVPKTFCYVQALAFQYAVYVQIVTALCFAFHIYQLLVHFKQGTSQKLQQFYMIFIAIIPVVVVIIATVVTIKVDAIGPLAINCDIKRPVWARLIGYSGFNLLLTFPGVYFSGRAAFQVFRHLDQFKSKISNGTDSNDSTRAMTGNRNNTNDTSPHEIQIHVDSNHEITNSEATTTSGTRTTITAHRRPRSQSRANQIKAYNMTKAAAIRMVLFACGFALINVLASFQTVSMILKEGLFGEVHNEGIGGNDLAGAFMGSMLFLVFGLPRNMKRCFSRENSDLS